MQLNSVKERVLTDPSFRQQAEELFGAEAVAELLASEAVIDLKAILQRLEEIVTTSDNWEADMPLDPPEEFWAVLYSFAIMGLAVNPIEDPDQFQQLYGLPVASSKGLLAGVEGNEELVKLVKQFVNKFRNKRNRKSKKTAKNDKSLDFFPIDEEEEPEGTTSDD